MVQCDDRYSGAFRPMSHMWFYRAIFVAQLFRATKSLHATAHVATATNRITNVACSDFDDNILASSLVLVSSVANQKRMVNPRAQKEKMEQLYVDAICCYRRSSLVCRSFCRPVCHHREPCKNGWTDRYAVWVVDWSGPKEPCISWGPDPSWEEAILRGEGEGRPIVKHVDLLPWAVQNLVNRSRSGLRRGLGWA